MKVFGLLTSIGILSLVSSKKLVLQEFESSCPSECSCDPLFRSISCSNGNLSHIPKGINRMVVSLDLSHNNYDGIPAAIEKLPKLKYLDLSYNTLITLIESYFHSSSIVNIQLNNCSIEYIDTSFLKGFPSLEILNLSNNPLSYLNNSLNSASLKVLDISRCNLKHIKPQSFLGTPLLLSLSLNQNYNLKQFRCESDSLYILEISNCNLEHVPSASLRKVVDVDLHGNNIQWLKNKSLANMIAVENLNLSYNAIKQIEVNSLSSLKNLTTLDLSYNRLSIIEKNTFLKTPILKSLDMSHNYIRKVRDLASNSMELLDLSFCEVTFLTQYSLENLPALRELHLIRNQISNLPNNLDSPSLVYLDISYNDISSINNLTFASLKSLKILILTGNKLTSIDPSFFPQITDLQIGDNPWLCDCDALKPMRDWLIKQDEKLKALRCQLPLKLEGLTWEDACNSSWDKTDIMRKNFWYFSLSFFITIAILIFLMYVSKQLDKRRKQQTEQTEERRIESERLEFIQRQQARERIRRLEEQEESRNAPDPRDIQSPPTYNEALLLPRLDASHPSLAGSLASLSSVRDGSNPDISKQRRPRRKRRRRKSSTSPNETNEVSVREPEESSV